MAKIFQIERCDFGFVYNGTKYIFDNVDSDTIENSLEHHLVRGKNSKSSLGLSYSQNNSQPYTRTLIVKGLSKDTYKVLEKLFDEEIHFDLFAVDRIDGSLRTSKDAILVRKPIQLNINDDTDSMNTEIVVEFFELIDDFVE